MGLTRLVFSCRVCPACIFTGRCVQAALSDSKETLAAIKTEIEVIKTEIEVCAYVGGEVALAALACDKDRNAGDFSPNNETLTTAATKQ